MQPISNVNSSTVDPLYNFQQSYESRTFQGQPLRTATIDVDSGEDVDMLSSNINEQIMKEKEAEDNASISNLFSSGENSEDDDIQQTNQLKNT